MRVPRWSVCLWAVVAGCGGGRATFVPMGEDGRDGGADTSVEADAEAGFEADVDAGPQVCGTGNRPLPEGLVELGWDDGTVGSSIDELSWPIEFGPITYFVGDTDAWEAVRFELDRPARVHGFAVRWAVLPDEGEPTFELEAGLYPDFGYNGFDFWAADPYWTGTRCLEDVREGEWVPYVLDEPLAIDQPGLVYVAHHREGGGEPCFFFDSSLEGEGSCGDFDVCHSAINLTRVEPAFFFNGATLPFPYDYLVRLYVEYTDEIAADELLFRPVPDLEVGSRVSWGDYDTDGWDDFVTNGPRLYRNAEGAGFEDVTEAAGLAAVSGGGGVWGDYDNDGCLDLFVFAESRTVADSLLRSNCDGSFEDVTDAAGIVDEQDYEPCGDEANVRSPSAAAGWIDLDADGYLDLYVANYICGGEVERYYVDTVFHNEGDGTFTDITATNGFLEDRRASRGASPVDFDLDGDVDLLVNTYRLQQNMFFENRGNGTVLERAEVRGLAGHLDRVGGRVQYGHTIGVAWGDLDGDGDFDLVEANLAHPRFFHFSDKTRVLIADDGGAFRDVSGDWSFPASDAGLRYQETHSSPVLADFDADGALDLVITAVYDGRPTDFYWGNGDGTFELDVLHAGITTRDGWGAAVSDYDNDGDLDLVASALFENRGVGAEQGHWLQVRVVGNVAANRAALGATVEVRVAERTILRHVQGGSGQGCQDSLYLHFGLGEEESVDSIRVTFPGGFVASFEGPFDVDQRLWLHEDGTVHRGWAPPL